MLAPAAGQRARLVDASTKAGNVTSLASELLRGHLAANARSSAPRARCFASLRFVTDSDAERSAAIFRDLDLMRKPKPSRSASQRGSERLPGRFAEVEAPLDERPVQRRAANERRLLQCELDPLLVICLRAPPTPARSRLPPFDLPRTRRTSLGVITWRRLCHHSLAVL